MAGQAKKNTGFGQVPHEAMQRFMELNLNGTQGRIVMMVWKYTFGFADKTSSSGRREWAELSHSFIANGLGLEGDSARKLISKEIKNLIGKGALRVLDGSNRSSKKYSFVYQSVDESVQDDESKEEDCLPISSPFIYQSVDDSSTNQYPKKEREEIKREIIKDINPRSLFEEFYSIYPNQKNKTAALNAWNKLFKEPDFDPKDVIRRTRNYAETCELIGTDEEYLIHPHNFLRDKRYEDYDTVDPEGLRIGGGNEMAVLGKFHDEGAAKEAAAAAEAKPYTVNGKGKPVLPIAQPEDPPEPTEERKAEIRRNLKLDGKEPA
ncbi:replication protein [Paenibacillus sp. BK720]|uniref:replication protein n=1 Tax=Paenibacillus sp. BK720 TaxID=2587092 RepID=UPI0014216119|nr:replication protein [Paenibacillus sp. BK720]NIK68776.1 hypothetical protein [Paenibacillus sp. BK720]